MKSFIRLTDHKKEELFKIFEIADSIDQYDGFLKGRTIVMFFPASSIRTRVSFEKGIYLLGGQSILFDPATLDKKEDIKDEWDQISQKSVSFLISFLRKA